MYLDKLLQLSSAQQITMDAVSDKSVDLGDVTPKRNIGDGEEMGLGIFIRDTGTTTGSAIVQLVSDTTEDLGTPTIIATLLLVTADLAEGKAHFLPIPAGFPRERYIGAYHDITGTVDYTVDQFIMPRSMFSKVSQSYAKNYTIS